MPERLSKKEGNRDVNVVASYIVEETTRKDVSSTKEHEIQVKGKNPNAVALGRLGGLKGGKARAEKLTPERRTEIAKKAALARWNK